MIYFEIDLISSVLFSIRFDLFSLFDSLKNMKKSNTRLTIKLITMNNERRVPNKMRRLTRRTNT